MLGFDSLEFLFVINIILNITSHHEAGGFRQTLD
jgi:hypothetical protein